MTSISKSQFYHLQRRTSDVKFRPSKCWLFFDNRGAIVKNFCFTKKNLLTVKKISKKAFFAKKTFYWTWIWKMLLSKKDGQGSYYWAQKKFQQEKIKIEGVAFISKKYLKSHFRNPKKRVFQFRILRSVSVCSLYLLQTVV